MNKSIDGDNFRKLISLGLEKGYVTHDDIQHCVPACAQSKPLLDEVVRLMVNEAHVDVFASAPSEEERQQGPNALANAALLRGVEAAFPSDD